MKLRLVALPRRERPAGIEGLVCRVIQLAQLAGHDAAEQVVGRFQDLRAGAEVFGEGDAPFLPLRRLVIGAESPILFQKDGGVGQAEAIDRLLHIAHQKEVFPVLGEGAEDRVLHLVRVLVFVHHDLGVALAPLAGQVSRLALVVHQEADGVMLQIGKIQHGAFFLFRVVGFGEICGQGEEAPHGGVEQGHVLQQAGAGAGQAVCHLAHGLFTAVPQAFDLFLRRDILYAAGGAEPGKRDHDPFGGGVPALGAGGHKMLQGLGRLFEAGKVGLFQDGVLQGQVAGRLHLLLPIGAGGFGVFQEQLAPRGLACVGQMGQVQGAALFFQPGQRIGSALDLFIDVQDDLNEAAVVPPGGEEVEQLGKVSVRVDVLIAFL